MKLQSKLAHMRNQSISINGTRYQLDGNGVADFKDADAKKLLTMADAWSDKIGVLSAALVSRIPIAGQAMRGASEFALLITQDEAVAAKVNSFRSFRTLLAFAEGLGFRFSEAEFQKAAEALKPQMAEESPPVAQTAVEAPKAETVANKKESKPKTKKGKDAKTATPELQDLRQAEDDAQLPDVLDEEKTGDWPDPTETMGIAYLKRMAQAYDLNTDSYTQKADLVQAISEVMYE